MWQTDECAWSVQYIWRWSDLLQRGIDIGLALMLAYTFFVLIRFLRRSLLARLESRNINPASSSDSLPGQKDLIADLSRGLWTLKAIGTAAPFLGLVGTSYGILVELSGWNWAHGSGLLYLLRETPANLLYAAAGMFVAIPATVIRNFCRSRVEAMRAELRARFAPEYLIDRPFRRAQTLPLRHRFSGPPQYAVIATPVFMIVIMVYMVFRQFDLPKGLSVHLLPVGVLEPDHRITGPIVISMVETQYGESSVRINAKEIPLDDLQQVLADRLKLAPERRVYVEAERGLAWGSVANVIDKAKRVHCEVVLLTKIPAPESKHGKSQRR